jgi:CRISPR-associated protein Cas6
MLWQEESVQTQSVITSSITDVVFEMKCRCLPIDHAYALSQAICQALPWFQEEPQAGLHLIHGAESGNGWYRPDSQESLLYLSRRTKLVLRLPRHRFEAVQALCGKNLDIAGYSLTLGEASEKPLRQMPVLFARHVLTKPELDEEIFLEEVVRQLQALNIQCHKALCGKSHSFSWQTGEIFTRSLMVAELTSQESIKLQEQGLGEGRKMGCGLFVPHKDVKPVTPKETS